MLERLNVILLHSGLMSEHALVTYVQAGLRTFESSLRSSLLQLNRQDLRGIVKYTQCCNYIDVTRGTDSMIKSSPGQSALRANKHPH